MRRCIYEWSSLLFALAAVACVTCFAFGKYMQATDFTLALPGKSIIRSHKGNVAIGDNTFDLFEIHSLASDPTLRPIPQSVGSFGSKFGRFTRMQYPDSTPWALTLSWLVPAFVSASLSFVCFRRYRHARSSETQSLAK